MVDARETEVGEGEAPQLPHGVVGRQRACSHVVEQPSQRGLVDLGLLVLSLATASAAHGRSLSCSGMGRIAFLGPPGTFTEEALLTQPDLAASELVPMRSV